MNRKAKGFVLDMDGTLLDLPVDWGKVRAEVSGLAGSVGTGPVFETIAQLIGERPDLKARLFSAVDRFELEAEPRAELFEGSKEVLELLSGSAELALVTMQGKKVRDKVLGRLGLVARFKVLVSREDSLERAGQLEMAVAKLGLRKQDVVFVGDRIHDFNSAARVGVEFVMIRDRNRPAGAEAFPNMKAFLSYLRGQKG